MKLLQAFWDTAWLDKWTNGQYWYYMEQWAGHLTGETPRHPGYA
jgi:hypothetical protein